MGEMNKGNEPMPKDFEGQDLRGENFKNRDLRGANFSRANIRGAKFTGADLVGAKFIRAQTGVQKRWMALPLCICISFVLCSLLDFVGILFAVVFTTFGKTLDTGGPPADKWPYNTLELQQGPAAYFNAHTVHHGTALSYQ